MPTQSEFATDEGCLPENFLLPTTTIQDLFQKFCSLQSTLENNMKYQQSIQTVGRRLQGIRKYLQVLKITEGQEYKSKEQKQLSEMDFSDTKQNMENVNSNLSQNKKSESSLNIQNRTANFIRAFIKKMQAFLQMVNENEKLQQLSKKWINRQISETLQLFEEIKKKKQRDQEFEYDIKIRRNQFSQLMQDIVALDNMLNELTQADNIQKIKIASILKKCSQKIVLPIISQIEKSQESQENLKIGKQKSSLCMSLKSQASKLYSISQKIRIQYEKSLSSSISSTNLNESKISSFEIQSKEILSQIQNKLDELEKQEDLSKDNESTMLTIVKEQYNEQHKKVTKLKDFYKAVKSLLKRIQTEQRIENIVKNILKSNLMVIRIFGINIYNHIKICLMKKVQSQINEGQNFGLQMIENKRSEYRSLKGDQNLLKDVEQFKPKLLKSNFYGKINQERRHELIRLILNIKQNKPVMRMQKQIEHQKENEPNKKSNDNSYHNQFQSVINRTVLGPIQHLSIFGKKTIFRPLDAFYEIKNMQRDEPETAYRIITSLKFWLINKVITSDKIAQQLVYFINSKQIEIVELALNVLKIITVQKITMFLLGDQKQLNQYRNIFFQSIQDSFKQSYQLQEKKIIYVYSCLIQVLIKMFQRQLQDQVVENLDKKVLQEKQILLSNSSKKLVNQIKEFLAQQLRCDYHRIRSKAKICKDIFKFDKQPLLQQSQQINTSVEIQSLKYLCLLRQNIQICMIDFSKYDFKRILKDRINIYSTELIKAISHQVNTILHTKQELLQLQDSKEEQIKYYKQMIFKTIKRLQQMFFQQESLLTQCVCLKLQHFIFFKISKNFTSATVRVLWKVMTQHQRIKYIESIKQVLYTIIFERKISVYRQHLIDYLLSVIQQWVVDKQQIRNYFILLVKEEFVGYKTTILSNLLQVFLNTLFTIQQIIDTFFINKKLQISYNLMDIIYPIFYRGIVRREQLFSSSAIQRLIDVFQHYNGLQYQITTIHIIILLIKNSKQSDLNQIQENCHLKFINFIKKSSETGYQQIKNLLLDLMMKMMLKKFKISFTDLLDILKLFKNSKEPKVRLMICYILDSYSKFKQINFNQFKLLSKQLSASGYSKQYFQTLSKTLQDDYLSSNQKQSIISSNLNQECMPVKFWILKKFELQIESLAAVTYEQMRQIILSNIQNQANSLNEVGLIIQKFIIRQKSARSRTQIIQKATKDDNFIFKLVALSVLFKWRNSNPFGIQRFLSDLVHYAFNKKYHEDFRILYKAYFKRQNQKLFNNPLLNKIRNRTIKVLCFQEDWDLIFGSKKADLKEPLTQFRNFLLFGGKQIKGQTQCKV